MIEVESLTKRFGRFEALRGVSFVVPSKSVVGLLGPNGAGKTTTMRVLAGSIPPTSGFARIDGLDSIKDSMAVRRRLGYLPEVAPLYPEMRVESFLRFRGRLQKLRGGALTKAVDGVIEQCWLGEMRRRRVGTLSKGYKQRVGLAAALLHDPPVVMLDEPTSGLDPAQIAEARKLIRELGREKTVLFSSHVLAEVEATCSAAVVIARGQVLASGSLEDLRAAQRPRARCIIEVKASNDPQSLLSATPGVRSVEAASPVNENGWRRYFVDAEHDAPDVRERLASAIVGAGGSVRELTTDRPSLEQAYMRLLESAQPVTSVETEAEPAS